MTDYLNVPPISLNGKTIKIVAIITMFIDHFTCCFLEVATTAEGISVMYAIPYGYQLDRLGRTIGRCAFPVFCFMLVEGFIHTRSRAKYGLRLLIFAAISEVPFCLIFFPDSPNRHADTIFTLLIGYLVIWGTDVAASFFLEEKYRPTQEYREHKETKAIRELSRKVFGDLDAEDRPQGFTLERGLRHVGFLAVSIALLFAGSYIAKYFGCDYSYGGVGTIMLLYYFYRIRPFSLLVAWIWLSVYNQNELMAITGFWLIYCYNGERGKQSKYFFYVFYPLHLMVLYLIRKSIFGM